MSDQQQPALKEKGTEHAVVTIDGTEYHGFVASCTKEGCGYRTSFTMNERGAAATRDLHETWGPHR